MIEQIVCSSINSKGRFKTSNEIIMNAWWFHLASVYGLVQPKIVINGRVIPLNYFGITIAGSSAGKSFALDAVAREFDVSDQKYSKVILNGMIGDEDIEVDGSKQKLSSYAPRSIHTTIEGTTEGLYLRALALDNSWCGSLNIVHEEILDVIKDSNLNKMKELYDGKFHGKVIKSSINRNINNIVANMLLFGSSIKIKKDYSTYSFFTSALGSGIHRRSFIFYEEPRQIELSNDTYDERIKDIIGYVKERLNNDLKERLNGKEIVYHINCNTGWINKELLKFSNENIDDERFSAEVGAFDRIVKLAWFHSICFGKAEIEHDDLEYAYDFYVRCRESTRELFNTEPQHKRIYRILKRYGELSKSEILEKDIFQRSTFNEDMQLLEELCYRNGEVLKISGNKIKYYKVEPLPSTDLSKIIVSVSNEGKGAKSTNFIDLVVPFFGEGRSIERIVQSDKIDAFCLCHFDGKKRKDENAKEGQNAIAFDFDEGLTINEAKEIFSPFTYILYTTKSHSEDNHRFRVVLPTKHIFYVSPEQHKKMIENVADLLQIPIYDVATRNISRLWFPNNKATVYKNEADLIDVTICLPESNFEEQVRRAKDTTIKTDDARLNGMIRWTIANAVEGNRNNALYRLYKFANDLGFDATELIYEVNEQLMEPLPEVELKKITRRIR